jgi:hypothetical protein
VTVTAGGAAADDQTDLPANPGAVMPHGTEHHLEEAEHSQHHAHNPFDRMVAVTMAIVAAALACVTMLSHRSHSATLQYNIQSNDNYTLAADEWSYYQAKKNRGYMYGADAEMVAVLSRDAKNEDAARLIDKFKKRAEDYENDAKKIQNEAEWLTTKAKNLHLDSVAMHHRSNRFDLGELGVEMALVLCSVALLTKRRPFWYAGMVIGVIGFAWAMTGFLPHGDHGEHPSESETHHSWVMPRHGPSLPV